MKDNVLTRFKLVVAQRFVNAAVYLAGVILLAIVVRQPEAFSLTSVADSDTWRHALTFIAAMGACLTLASLLVGVGLVRRQGWARWGEAALSILNLALGPVCGIVGGLVLVFLLGKDGQVPFTG